MENYPKVTVLDHPIIQHKVALLRDKNLPCGSFRQLVHEISMLEGYEALRGLPTELRPVSTPIADTEQPHIVARNICFVPILRAGLGMADGLSSLLPEARFGHIGLYRDEVTHEPHEYYCKLARQSTQSGCSASMARRRSPSFASSQRPKASTRSLKNALTSPYISARSMKGSTRTPISFLA